jgi:hypothetical protein
MQLSELLRQTLLEMDSAVASFTGIVPPARAVPFADGFVFRHVEQLPEQALVQKLARLPSALRAAQLLCDHGYYQDQGALQRVIDELQEDALFLAIPLMFGGQEDIHEQFLSSFFAEDYDPRTGKPIPEQRPMVPRKKIRAYIARSPIGTEDPSTHDQVSRVISKTYSGYVHSASPHIMDAYGGVPPRFFTSGMLGTVREPQHRRDIVNYYYRGFSSFVISAKALGQDPLFQRLYQFAQQYQEHGVG